MVTINVNTPSKTCMIDITGYVRKALKESEVKSGICTVFTPHTTAGITINENADPDVVTDILRKINEMVPEEHYFKHMEGNSAAHIKSSLFGSSVQVIVEDGKLMLGTWQGIYFCEFDGPRSRKVYIKVIEG